MIVLGLDPSLTGYGWALIDTEKNGRDSLLDFGVFKSSTKTYMPFRYHTLTSQLSEVVKANPNIDWVGIEHPPYNASYSLGLYALYMDSWGVLAENRLGYVAFLPTELKAYVRSVLQDDGKMFKSDMKDAMKQLLGGWTGRMNHNVADAYLVAYHAARFRSLLLGQLDEKDLTEKEAASWTRTVKRRKTGLVEKTGLIYKGGPNRWEDLQDPSYDKFFT